MIIYCITNNLNGKKYIGQTTKAQEQRLRAHKNKARYGVKTYFYNAIRKHGEQNFTIQTLKVCENQQELDNYEKALIQEHNTINPEIGYNVHPGGAPDKGYKPTKLQASRMSISMKAKWVDPEFRKKMFGNSFGRKSNYPMSTCHPEIQQARSRMGIMLKLCQKCSTKLQEGLRKLDVINKNRSREEWYTIQK